MINLSLQKIWDDLIFFGPDTVPDFSPCLCANAKIFDVDVHWCPIRHSGRNPSMLYEIHGDSTFWLGLTNPISSSIACAPSPNYSVLTGTLILHGKILRISVGIEQCFPTFVGSLATFHPGFIMRPTMRYYQTNESAIQRSASSEWRVKLDADRWHWTIIREY